MRCNMNFHAIACQYNGRYPRGLNLYGHYMFTYFRYTVYSTYILRHNSRESSFSKLLLYTAKSWKRVVTLELFLVCLWSNRSPYRLLYCYPYGSQLVSPRTIFLSFVLYINNHLRMYLIRL